MVIMRFFLAFFDERNGSIYCVEITEKGDEVLLLLSGTTQCDLLSKQKGRLFKF